MIDPFLSRQLSPTERVQYQTKLVAGVSLPELLITIAISGIVILLAGAGIANMTSANQDSKKDSKYLFLLNQTLEYISNDVREARSVRSTPPPGWVAPAAPGYMPVLFVDKPFNSVTKGPDDLADNRDNFVAYYLKLATLDDPSTNLDDGWTGEQVLYRRIYDGSGYRFTPIMDGLSTSSAPCGMGTIYGSNGFRVNRSGRKIQLCLQTTATDSGTPFSQNATVAIRNN